MALAASRKHSRLGRARRPAVEAPVPIESSAEDAESTITEEDSQSLREVTRRNVSATITNVLIWTFVSGGVCWLLYPLLQRMAWFLLVGGDIGGLSDLAQGYLGNVLAFTSLLFSILAGSSYSSLYSQNESIFCALFAEVSEAKALMEQVALVCKGRPFYTSTLEYIRRYVQRDLRQLFRPPAVLVACKPKDDPLESILFLTSVGVPSAIYETVRSLRQKRGDRLGAVQRKLPPVQMALLYVLGGLCLGSFLLFGISATGGEARLCRILFAVLSGALMMTMRVIHELWTPVGGAYNVDGVLAVMVRGLESELEQRLKGKTFADTRLPPPPPRWKSPEPEDMAAA